MNTRVQHVVPLLQIVKKTVEVPEVPLLQFTDKVADIPVVAQRQICVNEEVQKTIEDLQLQYTDGVVNVPAVLVVLVPQVQVVEKAEIHSFKSLMRWSMSLLCRSCRSHVCVP